jgi:threonine dehydrogenase-like Zn-dependent dehydrogenase
VHFTPVELDMINFLMKELALTAATEYPVEFPAVIEMLSSGKVDVRPLVSHTFPLSSFDEAFAQALRQNEAVKVLVDCQA